MIGLLETIATHSFVLTFIVSTNRFWNGFLTPRHWRTELIGPAFYLAGELE